MQEEGVGEGRAGSMGGRDPSDQEATSPAREQAALPPALQTRPLKVVPILSASWGQEESLPAHEGP